MEWDGVLLLKTGTGFDHTCLEGVHACLELGVVNYYLRLEPGYDIIYKWR